MDENLIGNENNLIFYSTDDGETKLEVLLKNEDVWLNSKSIGSLLEVTDKTVYKHINNIYEQGELQENNTVAIFATVGKNGQPYESNYYNLDMIISVGFRVNSKKAIAFRILANKILKEYIVQGFSLNEDRFLKGDKKDIKYFDRLLEKIKLIRTSERMFYQKITDIFAECSIDYDKESETANDFYANIQNKFHYAITNNTAAEIIFNRVDYKKENMGLTNWKESPKGKILKSDVSIAKKYLNKEELDELKDLVNIFLDIAENRAKRKLSMTMKDWKERVDLVLKTNDYKVLINKGEISSLKAKEKAEEEYDKYKVIQDKNIISDFDKLVVKLEEVKLESNQK